MSHPIAGRRRSLLAVAAVALAATMATPVATAAAHGPKASARVLGQVKSLKQQVAALTGTISGLQSKLEAVEGRKVQIPTSLPPSGPAGGVLAGSYPNPLLAPGSVGSAAIAPGAISSPLIADGSVFSTDIADGTIGSTDFATGVLGAGQMAATMAFRSNPNFIGAGAIGSNRVTCPPGWQMLGGGADFVPAAGANTASLFVDQSMPSTAVLESWDVAAHNARSSGGANLFAVAICLQPQP